jgi:xanthine dehydrogenase accessory factor
MDKNGILKLGKDLIDSGEDFVVAKVMETSGSTPRKRGAWLLMRNDGRAYGTVGGGTLEAAVELRCKEAFETRSSLIYHYALNPDEQDGIDMRCGGDTDVSIDYVTVSNPDLFFEDADVKPTVIIFGGGHVAKAIAPITHYLGFETIILDDRPEFASRERFPDAEKIVVLKDYQDAFSSVTTDENTYMIIVTRGHTADYDVLKQALTKPHGYLGMIGSKSKVLGIYQKLLSDGFSQEELDRVYSPIGLPIFAETPEEISISIAAELIKVRTGHGKF